MMDIEYFKDTLNSFSRLSSLGFSVFDNEKALFSTEELSERGTLLNDLNILSGRIIQKEKYIQVMTQDNYSLHGVPISNGNSQALSLIAYGNNIHHDRNGEIKDLLRNMAGIMKNYWSSKHEAEKMAREIDQSYEELYLYSKIATQVKTLRFTDTMQKELIEDLIGIMRVDIAFTQLLKNHEYNVLVSKPEISQTVDDPKGFVEKLISLIPKDGISHENSYFIINDSREHPGFSELRCKPFRFLAVQMRNNTNLEGWLGLISFNLNEIFRQSELSLLVTMAEQIAVVLSNQDLYRDMEKFVINVVRSLVQAIEAKDIYTRGHSERVNLYSMMIADELNMDSEEKSALHWASILHDIGKIGIPESILNKPDRLTDEEYEIIKTHPVKGFEILKPIEQLGDSVDGLLYHHERFDGSGYPRRLKDKEIPLMARIIAVADTFDAITSSRAYRAASGYEKAMKIIREVAGTQLDPDMVQIFDKLFNEGLLDRIEDSSGRQ